MEYYYDWNSDGVLEQRPVETKTAEPEASIPEVKQKKKSRLWLKIVAFALVCALIGGAVGAGAVLLFGGTRTGTLPAATQNDNTGETAQLAARPSENGTVPSAENIPASSNRNPAGQIEIPSEQSSEPEASQPQQETQPASGRETHAVHLVTTDEAQLLDATQVYERCVGSTVGITTEITSTNYWGFQSTSPAAGSGFILTEDGYILTNYHVIKDASTITVAMYDGKTYDAALIGCDESNDIAVLKIEAEGLTPVTLGSSDDLKVGQDVIAIGNPLGELTFSLTKGVVSALGREITLSSGVTMSLIQTDCAINSGNSGGALFDLYGRVIGITNAKYSSSSYSSEASIDNIGFAIPIDSVREIVISIIEKGYISKPYIGVTVSAVGEESQRYGLPQGLAIQSVEAGSPAEEAGLQANDIITALNGQPVTVFADLSGVISSSEIGTALELTVYRQGESITVTVYVGEKIQNAIPETSGRSEGQGSGGQGSNGQGGDPWGGSNPWGWGFGN